jgi:hypothetical protein
MALEKFLLCRKAAVAAVVEWVVSKAHDIITSLDVNFVCF